MENFTPVYGTGPLLGIAAGAIALLLFLIIRLRLHAFIALVLVSLLTAVAAGIPVAEIMPTLLGGFGGTLANVALLVGLGVMLGRMLEVTGGAAVLAGALIRVFGEKRAPLALGVASLLFGFPLFFDVGLVVMLPIVFSVARRVGGSVLTYTLPTAGAFAVMHAFVPPHPGPVTAAVEVGADMGLVLLIGLLLAIPTWYLSSYLFGLWIGKRVVIPVPDDIMSDGSVKHENPPHLATVVGLLLLPMLLIFANTGVTTLVSTEAVPADALWVQVCQLVGQTPVALLITVLVAMLVLSRGRFTRQGMETLVGDSLGPVCGIILITGAGGMFGMVLRTSGIGGALAESLDAIGLPVIVAAFVIALALRVAQGSATVAITTAAGLIAPAVQAADGLSSIDLALIVIAIASGATALSHVNDSGFWLVGRFLGMDVKTTLKTWTVMETLIGFIGFGLAFGLSLVL
ncbi:GntP family permease [Nocardiopsis changdeensis]|uniref:GntP family permease n=1 Tax=Nocardiopsis changdeensis TaxID=2831969 RepID=A0ABX8BPG2_9ACTN|nr:MULTISPECIES: GntP family permease [Nocardiopsis]QUX23937.1 GntP family permease [Nocardiopsis changdeensis]QYX39883.1 GntP family permease [Nocardiopsis sp. MT53]